MMADDDEQTSPKKIVYRMVVMAAGHNFSARAEIDSDDPADLEPKFVDINGVTYERYGSGEDDYVEMRFDLIVKRERSVIEEEERGFGIDSDEMSGAVGPSHSSPREEPRP
jgi:hypothetical protein